MARVGQCHAERRATQPRGRSRYEAGSIERRNVFNNGALLLIPVEGDGSPRRIMTPPPTSFYLAPTFSLDRPRLASLFCTGFNPERMLLSVPIRLTLD